MTTTTLNLSKTQETAIKSEDKVCAHNYKPLPVVLERGKGAWLWDIDGNKYLDMMSAYSAVSHGHSHPRLLKAFTEQASKLAICSRAFHTNTLGKFLDKICDLSGLDMALPMNTGAEAVETAIKAARRWGYQVKGIAENQAEIITAEQNFHGRTTTIISFATDEGTKKDFGPFTPGFKTVPFGDAKALEAAITPNTCAFLVEPMQGEAGIIVPPAGWLKEVAAICKKNNVLLILDEIQAGLGRTGKMFAFEHEGVKPDGLILGKALGGGMMPVSCFVAKKEVMELFQPGSHGSTFGGNPLAAAVGYEALVTLEDEKLVERSAELGAYLKEQLEAMDSPIVKEVRGRGIWIGFEIDGSYISGHDLCKKLMARGILAKETHDTTVRLAPPLMISKEEIDWALGELRDVLSTIAAGTKAA
ncbi:MAG: ornithine--oxo-acid transaminase [Magnetococcales bacterium]|nr:ornithine--oxo-acid transaminase [Magnetococcales bacterium]